MSLRHGRRGRPSLTLCASLVSAAALATLLAPGVAAAQSYSCSGVGVVDPVSGVAIVDPVGGGVGCVVIPGASMTLTGQVNEAADLGETRFTTDYRYDPDGNQLAGDSGGSITTTTAYDSEDRLTESSSSATPPGSTTYTYDNTGEPTSSTDGFGTIARYDYNGNQLLDIRDGAGDITERFQYDSQNRVIEITDGSGNPIEQMTYNSQGELESITIDATGEVIRYQYDAQGNMISDTDGTLTSTYTYDAAGNDLLSVTDPNGLVTTTSYDSLGRLSSDSDPNGSTTSFIFDQTVPEPSSLALLCGGLVALIAARRRSRLARA